MGIAGIGMRIVHETDWDVERVRWKALRLLRYTSVEKKVEKKKLLGRGKVLSTMPFNVFECIGVLLRSKRLRWIAVYGSMALVVLVWSLGLGCIYLGRKAWGWSVKFGVKLMDEVEDDSMTEDADSEEDGIETARLLS